MEYSITICLKEQEELIRLRVRTIGELHKCCIAELVNYLCRNIFIAIYGLQ